MAAPTCPRTLAVLLALSLATACSRKQENDKPIASAHQTAATTPTEGTVKQITVQSSAFAHQGEIPKRFTCEGDDSSPPLAWSNLPAGTKSLALILDDPDAPDPKAPKRVWVHWVLYNLPPSETGLPAGVKHAPAGARDGTNDWGRTGYGGPCPPIGRHRYFHKVYALDVVLSDLGEPTKAQLEQAMRGHVIAQGELIGTYQKGQ
jgi:hypothetical protein